MASGQLSSIVHFLRKATAPAESDCADGELLGRFASHQDEHAFAALMRRHGPMVFSVCRRVVRDWHAAEDAFQATFLILARKAASLTRPELLGPWLHGVAYRTSVRARAEAVKRRAHEAQAVRSQTLNAKDEFAASDLHAVLDEEVNRLPARYRVPVVLCYLQGQTNAEAARRLGCSRGTLATRLARARARLRRRLTQRGLSPSVVPTLTVLAQQAEGIGVPAGLETVTVKAAMLVATGQMEAAGALAAQAISLAKGVTKSMWVSKPKMAMILLAVSFAGVGASVTTHLALGTTDNIPAKTDATPAKAESKPQAATKSKEASPPVPQPAAVPADAEGSSYRAANQISTPEWKKPLPEGPPPVQALVALNGNDRLIVRMMALVYVNRETGLMGMGMGGMAGFATYPVSSRVIEEKAFDHKVVRVYDTKGKTIDPKEWPKLLKRETLVLVSADGRPVDPLHLRLFKEDTLIFVLPATAGSPIPPTPLSPYLNFLRGGAPPVGWEYSPGPPYRSPALRPTPDE